MKLTTQLYIDTSDNTIDQEANYELVEFFDFESIEITETIKNIQEIDVVFTDYTKEFVVPASKNNNKIFQHYYSTNLINSFDARIKKRARIFINGIFFKQGFVRLSASQVKNGYPYSYSLSFFGALSGLGDLIGEDKLADLDYLNRYSHEFNLSNAFSGLTKGLQYNGTDMEEYSNKSRDVVYPLISAENKWYYDSTGLGDVNNSNQVETEYKNGVSVNIYNDDGGSPNDAYGIDYKQLKPAIKVSNIFEAIDAKYDSINIKKDSFVYGSKLSQLYLLLHNRKGVLSQGIGDRDLIRHTFLVRTNDGRSDFNLDTSNPSFEELMPIITYTRYESGGGSVQQARNKTQITFNVSITTPSSGDIKYTMTILDGSNSLTTLESTNFTDSISYELETENLRQWDNLRFQMEADGSVSEYEVTMTLLETYSVRSYSASLSDSAWSSNTKTSDYNTVESSYSFPQTVEIFKQIPDMKVIDFMTGIFKMFNLVAKVDDETGEIDILPLNDYYVGGNELDITKYVDSSDYDVERLQLYGNINFKFEEASTFGLLNHNEVNQDTFGDLIYPKDKEGTNNNFIFDKGNYDVDVPFEKLYFSRMSNEQNGADTDICDSWLVDKDESPVLTKPILFFNVNTTIDANDYDFGVRGVATQILTYNRGSNSNSDGSLSLNFNAEIDEFTKQINENSLFNTYYSSYVKNTFNKESRNLKINAKFPLSFLFDYSLADRLLIKGSPFIINEVTTNLNTGISQLDLTTAFSIDVADISDTDPPSDVTGVLSQDTTNNSISIIWNQNTELDLAGYNVYIKTGVGSYELNQTLGVQNNYTITGLTQNTSYDIKVTAFDEAGNESVLADATEVTQSTGNSSDVQAPSIPQNLTLDIIGATEATVSWTASTDNVGVALYNVYVDDVLQTPTDSNTFYSITGLVVDTTYEVSVSAQDAAGNESAKSTPITITTTGSL